MRIVAPGIILASLLLSGCGAETVQHAATGVTRHTVKLAKATMVGIGQGIEQGREAAAGTDGTLVITSDSDVKRFLTISVREVRPDAEAGKVDVDLSITNDEGYPIKVAGFDGTGAILAIDKDGFAGEMVRFDGETTMPPKAKVKRTAVLQGDAANVTTVRVMGHEYGVPK